MEPVMRTIALVRNERRELVDDNWDDFVSTIVLAEDVPSSSLRGLGEFSHVEIVFFASLAQNVPPGPWHRHPRGNTEWPDVGIFAQRNKDRPNRLMLSVVALEKVDKRSLVVRGLDAINDTQVLDIKPVYSWSGPRSQLRVATWSEELGKDYF
ncbi:MAG: TrmO family methyltransferase domain-containing protein [Acidimicrobiales bacterium]